MSENIKELIERNKLVIYEYEDDEFSNINERYIKYNPMYAEYRVDVEGINAGFKSLVEAREFRNEVLKKKGVVLIER